MNFRDRDRRSRRQPVASGEREAKQQAQQRLQHDVRAAREMIVGWPMIKRADSSGRFMPYFHLGDRALKTR